MLTGGKESSFRECVNSLHNLYILGRTCEGIRILILGLQPRDKAGMLGVNTVEFFLEVPRGEKCFCSWPPTWPP